VKSAFWELLLIVTLCVIAVGFYRGWFTVSGESSSAPTNKIEVNLTVDRDKVNEDAQSVKEKTTEPTGEATEEAETIEKQITSRFRNGSSSSP
jgi:hypothetical protein